jgi:hypothetical protein
VTYSDLVRRIGGRRVIVDRCLPNVLVENLCRLGLKAVYVEALKPGMKDEEISLFVDDGSVLLTRDYEFARRLGKRAILLKLGYGWSRKRPRDYLPWKAKREARILFDSPAYEEKISRGMTLLFGKRALSRTYLHAWEFPNY